METNALNITSPAFKNEGDIPTRYTCDGEELSPPLHIDQIPEQTRTLALIAEDPDAPQGTFDHWIAWNIQTQAIIAEGERPGISGHNSAGKTGYHPPCPPDGTHRYYFYFFALDTAIDLPAGASKEELKQAMEGHIIARGDIMGHYGRTGE